LFAADKDLLSIEAFPGDVITFTTQLTNTEVLLELFDENGSALGMTGTNQLSWEAPKTGIFYMSLSPLTENFGCSNIVGYIINLERKDMQRLFLPIILK
jgi:hypothetical protein